MGTAVEPPPPPASRRPRSRRALRTLSTLLLVVGTLVLVDALLTVTWQEPFTAGVAALRQHALSGDLDALRSEGPTAVERRALARIDAASATEAGGRDAAAAAQEATDRRLAFLARSLKRRSADGAAIGRIEIPKIGVDKVVVDGTDAGDLRTGPGFYGQTALPGVHGTTAIAGHRTTYGAPFRHVDRLRVGDTIRVTMPYATFTYTVENTRIVKPTALWVIDRVKHDRLVLSACHPLFSAAERIVIFARLTRTDPVKGGPWTGVGDRAATVKPSAQDPDA